jgi:peptidoglycan/xylan/chitin deacetylase (PgdA/CDA1 family)
MRDKQLLPILTYHSLDASGSVISMDPSVFRDQMTFLKVEGFQTLSLTEATRILHEKEFIPEKSCVITFDDGYRNVYTEGFPILQELSFKATSFLITDYCGKRNNWPTHFSPVGDQELLSWGEIREMDRYGIEFGSHTLSHPDLTKVALREAERELEGSKEAIQSRLGKAVEVFAYPYGRYSPAVINLARKHFEGGACSTRLGKVATYADRYLLKRLDTYYLRFAMFRRTLSSRRYDAVWAFRQVLRDLRSVKVEYPRHNGRRRRSGD